MAGHGPDQYYDGQQGMNYFAPPSQPSAFGQPPSQHGGPPFFPPMNYPAMQPPQPMNFQTGLPVTPQQFGRVPQMTNHPAPGGGLPVLPQQFGPPAPPFQPNTQPIPPTFHHGPMAAAPAEVMFDPTTPAPFADRAQSQTPRRHGVLKITNIPYTISLPEMHNFITKYVPVSHLITSHVQGFPTHIIMERSTGKTMDAYIELKSPEIAEADWAHAFGLQRMRVPKIGQRNVEVSVSSQAELMKELFPRAKCVHWDNEENGKPRLVSNRDVYSSGFNGFMTTEELTCMVRHAETPQRSQFASRSMNRPYECMISTAYKFPWYCGSLYTMQQALDIYKAYKRQLDALIAKVTAQNVPREVGLDNKLLMDFIFAGLNTPGFSEREKAAICDTCVVVGTGFPLSKHAASWPFLTLSTHPHSLSDQDVGMWLEILNIGMGVMESQGRPFIGIAPHLQVVRDTNGQITFMATEQGLGLTRAAGAVRADS